MLEFTILPEEPESEIKWPISGALYTIEIMVEHMGPYYDDHWVNVTDMPDEINDLLYCGGLTFIELTEGEDLPLASGYYEVVVEFYHEKCIDWESGYDEGGDYLNVISCKRIRDLDLNDCVL